MQSHKTEFYDSETEYHRKLHSLVQLLRQSQYTVVYTGAGISTSADIPDIRGDRGLERNPSPLVVLGLQEHALETVVPTFAHRALRLLMNEGIVNFVTTSNHDGLHQKAGILSDTEIADVFGNVYVEKCVSCKSTYRRQVITANIGRKCDDPHCRGRLLKTGTRMGGIPPEEPLQRAWEHAQKADLAIVLGSSMTVGPFCDLPGYADNVVLCTLQETPYDSSADVVIHEKCDRLMRDVLRELGFTLEMPPLLFSYPFLMKWEENKLGHFLFSFNSEIVNEPCSYIKNVVIDSPETLGFESVSKERDFQRDSEFTVQLKFSGGKFRELLETLQVKVFFKDAYGVDPLVMEIDVCKRLSGGVMHLSFNWIIK